MKIALEMIRIALAAIWANRLRSALTLLGVIIGVTSVITIISALEGLMQSFEDQLSVLGPTTFIVTNFGIITSEEDFLNALKRKDFTLEDMRAVAQACPDCEAVAGRDFRRASVKRGNQGLRRVPIVGGSESFLDVVDIQIEEGRSYTEDEYDRRNQVAVIGPTVAEELFGELDPIGKTMKISGRRFVVIGVTKKRGAFLADNQDNLAIIPLSTFTKIFGRPGSMFNLMVKASSIEKLQDTQDQIRAVLRARRGVKYNEDDDFAILTADNILAFVDNLTRGIRFALIAISSIAMVVGGIVIMNIMMVSVTERTREIGIRKSIGARRGNILQQFLYESLILSLGGGIMGTVLGIVIAIVLGGQISLPVTPTFFAIATGILISTCVGVFFGMYPAVKASRLDPIEALRFES